MTTAAYQFALRPQRSFDEIAARTGIPRSTVYRIYRRALLQLEANDFYIPRRAPRRRKQLATA